MLSSLGYSLSFMETPGGVGSPPGEETGGQGCRCQRGNRSVSVNKDLASGSAPELGDHHSWRPGECLGGSPRSSPWLCPSLPVCSAERKGEQREREVSCLMKGLIYSFLLFVLCRAGFHTPPLIGFGEKKEAPGPRIIRTWLLSHEAGLPRRLPMVGSPDRG